jgi:hypothetical protein
MLPRKIQQVGVAAELPLPWLVEPNRDAARPRLLQITR